MFHPVQSSPECCANAAQPASVAARREYFERPFVSDAASGRNRRSIPAAAQIVPDSLPSRVEMPRPPRHFCKAIGPGYLPIGVSAPSAAMRVAVVNWRPKALTLTHRLTTAAPAHWKTAWRNYVVAAIAGIFLAITGAFGTGSAPATKRFVFWSLLHFGGSACVALLALTIPSRSAD